MGNLLFSSNSKQGRLTSLIVSITINVVVTIIFLAIFLSAMPEPSGWDRLLNSDKANAISFIRTFYILLVIVLDCITTLDLTLKYKTFIEIYDDKVCGCSKNFFVTELFSYTYDQINEIKINKNGSVTVCTVMGSKTVYTDKNTAEEVIKHYNQAKLILQKEM